MKRIMSCLLVLTLAFSTGCSINKNSPKQELQNKEPVVTGVPEDKPEEQPGNGKWESIDRLRYIRGTIVTINKTSDGRSMLTLKVEENYHNGADPVGDPDFPFKRGSAAEFFLIDQHEINLDKIKRVIIYESNVTTNGSDRFPAASIRYYEVDGKYYDMDGKSVSLPPTEYPQTFYDK